MIELGRIVAMRERKLADHQRAERLATGEFAAASAAVEHAQAEMRAYAEEVRGIESRMLGDLIGREIRIDDIRKIEEELERVKTHAGALAAAHAEAKQCREDAQERLAKARHGRERAEAKFNKISEIEGVLAEERRLEARSAEDAEMDAFVDLIAGRGRG